MTSIGPILNQRITAGTAALKILADIHSGIASPSTQSDAFDVSRSSSRTLSPRTLDAFTRMSAFDGTYTGEKLRVEGTKWSYRPQHTAPNNQFQEPIVAKDEAAIRALGADGWVAHYAPKLSLPEFEAEARKTLEYNIQSSEIAESFDYYKSAFEDPNTQSALSQDGKVMVSRESLELATKRYRIEMSVRHALSEGLITFSRPEDEVGLDYVGVSYDLYKNGDYHGNYLNYACNSEYADNLEKQGIGTYSWGVGLLGFYAKYRLLDMSEIDGPV